MKKIPLVMLCLVIGFVFATAPAAAQENGRQEVVYTGADVGDLVVDVPRPQVTFLLLRARLDHESDKSKVKLAPRIQQALERDPF